MEIDKTFDYVSNVPHITKEMVMENGYEWYVGDFDDEKTITADEFGQKKSYMESGDDTDK